jgi:hypothetical protein
MCGLKEATRAMVVRNSRNVKNTAGMELKGGVKTTQREGGFALKCQEIATKREKHQCTKSPLHFKIAS